VGVGSAVSAGRAPHAVQALSRVYDRSPFELRLGPDNADGSEDVIRREFMRLAGALVGGAALGGIEALEPWERLARAVRQPTRTDSDVVRHLDELTVTFESLDAHTSPKALIRPVSGHLATITGLLDGTPALPLRKQLLSLAGETAGLLAWISWDLGAATREQARAYVRIALDAAREADDRALGAHISLEPRAWLSTPKMKPKAASASSRVARSGSQPPTPRPPLAPGWPASRPRRMRSSAGPLRLGERSIALSWPGRVRLTMF